MQYIHVAFGCNQSCPVNDVTMRAIMIRKKRPHWDFRNSFHSPLIAIIRLRSPQKSILPTRPTTLPTRVVGGRSPISYKIDQKLFCQKVLENFNWQLSNYLLLHRKTRIGKAHWERGWTTSYLNCHDFDGRQKLITSLCVSHHDNESRKQREENVACMGADEPLSRCSGVQM